jgi:hypothetical protein
LDIKIQPLSNINFGILKHVKKRPYGTFMDGVYKGLNVEVYDADIYNQRLIYISDSCRNFIKSKLIYFVDGIKKIARAEGKGHG